MIRYSQLTLWTPAAAPMAILIMPNFMYISLLHEHLKYVTLHLNINSHLDTRRPFHNWPQIPKVFPKILGKYFMDMAIYWNTQFFFLYQFFEIERFYIFLVTPGSWGVNRYPWFQNRSINVARTDLDKRTSMNCTLS